VQNILGSIVYVTVHSLLGRTAGLHLESTSVLLLDICKHLLAGKT
jgi:hypothetical protein